MVSSKESTKERDSKPLKIPDKVSDRKDVIQGIGSKEIKILVCSLLAAIAVTILLYVFTQNPFLSFMIGGLMITVAIVAVRRDAINESMIDKIRIIMKYNKSQKKYKYRYTDVFKEE